MLDWWAQLNNLIYVIMGSVVASFVLLVRKVLTNEKQIELLKAEIKQRNEARKEYDVQLASALAMQKEDVNNQLAEIRHDIKNILSRDSAFLAVIEKLK